MDLENIKHFLKTYSLNKWGGIKFRCHPELVNGLIPHICPVCMQNDCIDFIIFKIEHSNK